MAKHFAVVIDRIGQVKAVAVQLCDLEQGGNTVDLLIRSKPRKRFLLQAFLAGLSIHTPAALARWDYQCDLEIARAKQHTEREVKPIRQAFAEVGTEIHFHVYTGPFEQALRELMKIHGATLDVIRVRKGWPSVTALRRALRRFGISSKAKSPERPLAFRHGC